MWGQGTLQPKIFLILPALNTYDEVTYNHLGKFQCLSILVANFLDFTPVVSVLQINSDEPKNIHKCIKTNIISTTGSDGGGAFVAKKNIHESNSNTILSKHNALHRLINPNAFTETQRLIKLGEKNY